MCGAWSLIGFHFRTSPILAIHSFIYQISYEIIINFSDDNSVAIVANSFEQFQNKNSIVMNKDKTKMLTFTNSSKVQLIFDVTVNCFTTILGLRVNNKLDWRDQVTYVCKELNHFMLLMLY